MVCHNDECRVYYAAKAAEVTGKAVTVKYTGQWKVRRGGSSCVLQGTRLRGPAAAEACWPQCCSEAGARRHPRLEPPAWSRPAPQDSAPDVLPLASKRLWHSTLNPLAWDYDREVRLQQHRARCRPAAAQRRLSCRAPRGHAAEHARPSPALHPAERLLRAIQPLQAHRFQAAASGAGVPGGPAASAGGGGARQPGDSPTQQPEPGGGGGGRGARWQQHAGQQRTAAQEAKDGRQHGSSSFRAPAVPCRPGGAAEEAEAAAAASRQPPATHPCSPTGQQRHGAGRSLACLACSWAAQPVPSAAQGGQRQR